MDSINRNVGAACELEFEAGGCDDDVGLEVGGFFRGEVGVCETGGVRVGGFVVAWRGAGEGGVVGYAGGGDGFDGSGGDVGVAAVEGLEEVAVGGDADALFPGVVAWHEVWIDRNRRWEGG